MGAVGRFLKRAAVLGWRLGLAALLFLALYAAWLVDRLDISRSGLEARARAVEATVVPSTVAGPDRRYYDAALELPLSLPAERVPDYVGNAFIVREDQQFRRHFGVNPITMGRALFTNLRRSGGARKLVGGSTITMQLVKNLLLNQEQTLDRKFNELVLATIVEIVFTKDEILAMYLNTAYFGEGTYGIEAAARKFFGRSVGYEPKVNMFEAAMLANSVQQPSRLNPRSQRPEIEKRAHALIEAMAQGGYGIAPGQDARDPGIRTWSLNPYLFRDTAMRYMVPRQIRERRDPLVFGFTIDTEAQLYAELAATDLLARGRAAGYDSSAIVVMEPDGAVAALATGHAYDGIDVVRNGRISPGSTLKPFMYLCALERGMRPDDEVNDRKRKWPQNFSGRNYGIVTLEQALIRSLNTIAVQLFETYGGDCFAAALARIGIGLDHPEQPTAVLGSENVSLLSLAAGYAALSNGGYRVEPYAIRYARTRAGQLIYRHASDLMARPVVGERPYCDLLGMLRKVVSSKGTGSAAALDIPVWGKTGTSEGHRDVLFAGFTGRYVAVVWLGRQARGRVRGAITGGDLPAETFRWLMATLESGKPPRGIECRKPIEVAGRSSARG